MKMNSFISSEVLFIISQLPASYKKKIPTSLLKELYNSYSKEYYTKFIPDKPFFKQELSEESLSFFYDVIEEYL
ncbi:MAG: hypothetical protein VZS44_06670 [Bacilli bacterium]|nr:hypothetical protein [Bacilli bacterium]